MFFFQTTKHYSHVIPFYVTPTSIFHPMLTNDVQYFKSNFEILTNRVRIVLLATIREKNTTKFIIFFFLIIQGFIYEIHNFEMTFWVAISEIMLVLCFVHFNFLKMEQRCSLPPTILVIFISLIPPITSFISIPSNFHTSSIYILISSIYFYQFSTIKRF